MPERRPPASELLQTPGALLDRSDLAALGFKRRAADALFRILPVIKLPGYTRTMVRADDVRDLLNRSEYRDDRVRPVRAA